MSDDHKGDGDSDKTDGKDDKKKDTTYTKDDLTNKYRAGRDEGIDKGKRDALAVVNKALGAEFQSLEEAETGLPEVASQKVEESEIVQSLQDKLKEKEETINNLQGKVQDFRVSGQKSKEYNSALGDQELAIDVEDAQTLFEKNYDYVEQDGKLFATKNGEKVLGEDGDFATVGEAFSSFLKEKGYVKGNAQGGTGGGTQPKGKDSDTKNPFVTGNITEQSRLYREDRATYDRLKAQAKK